MGFDMGLKEQITEDMKAAMRAKDAGKLGAIRLITAAIKQKEVDERVVLDDAQVQAIVEKMIKQRKDSIAQFEAGGRQDLVEIEKAELDVLAAYMPAAASDEEVQAEVSAAVVATGAAGPQDMGKVMGILKGKLAGRADMTVVSGLVKAALTKA
ncbi:aspartyl-tRNA amidotransferase subunit B [Oxalicibacterium flavum]|uniref:Aspartyl-tRNA amidotransferase subunit B n=2 Tax=Oxalicibacterium flavum TaxID=179467 RepID=A0A8J2XXV7_9BURK|nr:aspartyl-tRNA amidotransferase subunit B [Oxalicibacterium flavum]